MVRNPGLLLEFQDHMLLKCSLSFHLHFGTLDGSKMCGLFIGICEQLVRELGLGTCIHVMLKLMPEILEENRVFQHLSVFFAKNV